MENLSLSSSGPPETVIKSEDQQYLDALDAALAKSNDEKRNAVAEVVKQAPTFLDAWARLGECGRDDVESYAAYRVGYHRGLDKLRQNGWRGSGYVRWQHESNRGFLRALNGLRKAAEAIGEDEEAARCKTFLAQLDPDLKLEEID